MREARLKVGIKNNAAGFLGFIIEHQDGKIEPIQPGLTDHAIVAMSLQHVNPTKVPALKAALGHDKVGIP
eukprot:10017887-Ditylum_brightwellii.AAC.1